MRSITSARKTSSPSKHYRWVEHFLWTLRLGWEVPLHEKPSPQNVSGGLWTCQNVTGEWRVFSPSDIAGKLKTSSWLKWTQTLPYLKQQVYIKNSLPVETIHVQKLLLGCYIAGVNFGAFMPFSTYCTYCVESKFYVFICLSCQHCCSGYNNGFIWLYTFLSCCRCWPV